MPIFTSLTSSYILIFCSLLFWLIIASVQAKDTEGLRIISSSDPGSNENNSFIVVPSNQVIPEGIKRKTQSRNLSLQSPFVIELIQPPSIDEQVVWKVVIAKKEYGSMELLSNFKGRETTSLHGFSWQSSSLDSAILDRHKLVFRPKPKQHRPRMYKKGKGPKRQRRQYGGGTKSIDDQLFNPRLSYHVFVDIIRNGQVERKHQAVLQMDNIDMIRQEYINHYNIPRYGRGDNGNLPVPSRDEISPLPEKSPKLTGNPITESEYRLLVNDGIYDLAIQVADIYQQQIQYFRKTPLKDINKRSLEIPNSQLWLSGGWRNPERNEWFSNATNGIHQRGGAVDIIIAEAPNTKRSAIAYWILWKGLEMNRNRLDAFWQLETNGRPMRTREFKEDIEPENGLPDAFDKADHLHININYETK